MVRYEPLKISNFETGLVQDREEFDLADDAFPVLENAYVFRGRVRKKSGASLVGRLRRLQNAVSYFLTDTSVWTLDLFTITGGVTAIDISGAPTLVVTTQGPHGLSNGDEVVFNNVGGTTQLNGNTYTIANVSTNTFEVTQAGPSAYTSGGTWISNRSLVGEGNAMLECGTFSITLDDGGANEVTLSDDDGNGTLTSTDAGLATGTINYLTGAVAITHTIGTGLAVTITYAYFPGLPVMGLRTRELTGIAVEQAVAFDTKYAYIIASGKWREFIPGMSWSGNDSDFFYSSNYWVDSNNNTLFWATNFSTSDPMRYTNGTTWTDFAPSIDGTNSLHKARFLLPYRGRLFAAHTYEGTTIGNATEYRQRLRWAQIGSPIESDSWRQDTAGKGNYLDIPTAETITGVEFIRDDLIVFCDRSTWIVRHTGRSIQPFYVEKRNTELGGIGAFAYSAFDTSVMVMGAERLARATPQEVEPADTKIINQALSVEDSNNGYKRVHAHRDIPNKLAYWTFNDTNSGEFQQTYPNRRLVYNYEADAWAIFKDYFTCFGKRWELASLTWTDVGHLTWEEYTGTWKALQDGQPVNVAGNHHGYVFDIEQNQVTNDESLYITAITGNTTTATTLTVPNHNLESNDFIVISDIPSGTGYASLNGNPFRVIVTDANTLSLETWDTDEERFLPQLDASATYVGCGQVAILDNFKVRSVKFNYNDLGEKIQVGFIDVLTTDTASGQFTGKIYADYNEDQAINEVADSFFNSVLPTTNNPEDVTGSSRSWHRFFCPSRANFITYEWTLSDEQMIGDAAKTAIEIHQTIIWKRKAGR